MRIRLVMGIRRADAWKPRRHLSPPPARTERGPHNRTPATRTPTAYLVDGQMGEEERETQNAPRNGRRHPPGDAPPPPPLPQAK